MSFDWKLGTKRLLAGLLAGSLWVLPVAAQSTAAAGRMAAPTGRYQPNRFPKRAQKYYEGVWGVDSIGVRLVESGEIVRFTYRVLDADKAKVLNDKSARASLIDPRAGVSLVVPELPFVGMMRAGAPPDAGKTYFMAFSNKGRPVKRGDRVTVVIGQFRAEGLVVE